jgi:hypothetical protein
VPALLCRDTFYDWRERRLSGGPGWFIEGSGQTPEEAGTENWESQWRGEALDPTEGTSASFRFWHLSTSTSNGRLSAFGGRADSPGVPADSRI